MKKPAIMEKKEAMEPQEPVRQFPPLARPFPEETDEERALHTRKLQQTAIANVKKCYEEKEVTDFVHSFIIKYVSEGMDLYLDTDKSKARLDTYIEAVEEVISHTFNELLTMQETRKGEAVRRIKMITWALWNALTVLDEHDGTWEELDQKMRESLRPICDFYGLANPHVVAEEDIVNIEGPGEEDHTTPPGEEEEAVIVEAQAEGEGEEEEMFKCVVESTLEEEEEEDIMEWVGEGEEQDALYEEEE